MRPVVLTIAGSDPSGGAGLQADLKTFHAHGAYGEAVVSLLTVQNSVGVREVVPVEAALIGRQLEALFDDIPPRAAKTGALPDAATVECVSRAFAGRRVPLVVDPVCVSTSGHRLGSTEVVIALREVLLPLADLVTPNLTEAALLTGMQVETPRQAREAAERLVDMGAAAALVTGGHLSGAATDWLAMPSGSYAFEGPRIATRHTHGTGCAYSAAIACRLARGETTLDAVAGAKRWLTEAIRQAPGLGAGHGPVSFFVSTD